MKSAITQMKIGEVKLDGGGGDHDRTYRVEQCYIK